MAAFGQPLYRPLSGSNHRISELSQLPNGRCSYRDLNAGANAPTCGCRRFWLNVAGNVVGQEIERAWCFCGHHACFHEVQHSPAAHVPSVENADEAQTYGGAGGVEGATASSRRHSDFVNRALADPIFNSNNFDATSPTGRSTTGLGIRQASLSHSQSINTRLWQALNGFARDQESDDASKLPPAPGPGLGNEPTSSPFRATHDYINQHRSMGPPVNIPAGQVLEHRAEDYSATEVATPSVAGTPDFRALALPGVSVASPSHRTSPVQGPEIGSSRVRPTSHTTPPPPPPPPLPAADHSGKQLIPGLPASLSLQEIRNTIQDYGRRLSVLESMSFSQIPHDEIQDKFESTDVRLLDLEHWRTEQECRAEQDASPSPELDRSTNSKHRRLLPEVHSSASDGSFDSNAAAQTEAVVLATIAANAETRPRIEALEARVDSLESAALPTFLRPWHVQVVLLPFGRQLPGIWFSASESTEHSIRSTQMSEEWSGAPPAVTSSFMSSDGAWTTDSIQAWANETQDQWLSPKACGPSGAVFQRLSSRGFVREVSFTAPDSYHVLNTISSAFGSLLPADVVGTSDNADKFRGLREPFIPLRKIRKSSRLRFLTPAEMVTSATWTASFLESSVLMHIGHGQRRLYVTTPEAYLQKSSITMAWPTIKALPMYDADGEEQAAQARGHVVEACWSYNDRLDRIASLHSSFATHEDSQWDPDDDDSPLSLALGDDNDDVTPAPGPISAHHLRSTSLPSATSDVLMHDPATISQRRIASFTSSSAAAHYPRPTPSLPLETSVVAAISSAVGTSGKRRRISVSPELERRGVNFTPATSHRFSREPPSPGITSSGGGGGGSGAPHSGHGNGHGSGHHHHHHHHHHQNNVPVGHPHSQATSSNHNYSSYAAFSRQKRGTTPFAYATPHSHSEFPGSSNSVLHHQTHHLGVGGREVGEREYDGDTEVNTAPSEREWEGVQEGNLGGEMDGDYGYDARARVKPRAKRKWVGGGSGRMGYEDDGEEEMGKDEEEEEEEEEEDEEEEDDDDIDDEDDDDDDVDEQTNV